jgi:hypothetical protein
MNFISILKQIFKKPPTLDEFIKAGNPATIADVEYLERKYEEFLKSTEWNY